MTDHPSITLYRGHNRGHRYGFRVSGGINEVHDSGLIYNDEIHANIGIAKFMGYKDKDGFPIRGSRISLNKHCDLGPKAQRMLRNGGAEAVALAASRLT